MKTVKPEMITKYRFLFLLYIVLIVELFCFNDSIIAVLSAFFGITYTFLAGKGNPNCYLFGVSGSSLYAYLAYSGNLWGNLILYVFYYIPMQIIGFFKWNKNLKEGKNEIVKTHLTQKEGLIISILAITLSIILSIFLFKFGDKSPVIDSITTIFSIVGMYLTVKRCIEQWIVWIIVNGLSTIMWLNIAMSGEKVYATVFMWFVYFIFAIIFYFEWKREILDKV